MTTDQPPKISPPHTTDSMTTDTPGFDWRSFIHKPWVIIATGYFLPPAGIILAWLQPKWTPRTKWIATGVMALLFIFRTYAGGSAALTRLINEEPGPIIRETRDECYRAPRTQSQMKLLLPQAKKIKLGFSEEEVLALLGHATEFHNYNQSGMNARLIREGVPSNFLLESTKDFKWTTEKSDDASITVTFGSQSKVIRGNAISKGKKVWELRDPANK
jgi:hypothetical protein